MSLWSRLRRWWFQEDPLPPPHAGDPCELCGAVSPELRRPRVVPGPFCRWCGLAIEQSLIQPEWSYWTHTATRSADCNYGRPPSRLHHTATPQLVDPTAPLS